MAVRFTQAEKNTMYSAYVLAGQNKPNKAKRQEIADQFGCSLDRVNEYFKYLIKKSKKAKTSGDSFKHHPLSASYSNGLGESSLSPSPGPISAPETPETPEATEAPEAPKAPSPPPESKATEELPEEKKSEQPTTSSVPEDSPYPTPQDQTINDMMWYIILPEN